MLRNGGTCIFLLKLDFCQRNDALSQSKLQSMKFFCNKKTVESKKEKKKFENVVETKTNAAVFFNTAVCFGNVE